MEEAFDPFGIEEAGEKPDSSFLTTTSTSSSTTTSPTTSNLNQSHHVDFQSQFDASFGGSSPNGKSVPTTKKALNKSMNSSLDSDIYSQLFQVEDPNGDGDDNDEAGAGGDKDTSMYGMNASYTSSIASSSPNRSQPIPVSPFSESSAPKPKTNNKILTTKTHIKLPVYVNLHETMSCVYDDSKQQPSFHVDGEINLIPNKFIQGQSFYIALKDQSKHLGDVTTYFDCARELPMDCKSESDAFVKRKQEENCRVFKVDIPEGLVQMLDMKPIKVMKFNGSEFLRPIPLLVHCKVKVGGNLCRVGVKVRANPMNKKNIQNVAIIMAVPPDVTGETMKMSLRGGVWDPMRRIIIWSAPTMKNGETIEFQLQFDYQAVCTNLIPSFPILVRCDAEDQLSDVQIEVGGETYYDANGDLYKQSRASPFKMNLSKSYRLFHRKT